MRQVGDLDTAEELAQDAFVAAIEKWRQDGVPDNPAAWLNTTARFLAVDRIRRRDTQRGKYHLVAASQPQALEHDLDEIVDGDLADDLLGLIFMACHPILSPDARSALTLKLVCGLSTEDVARAFLAPAPTIAQRIVRAKRTLAAAKVRFELPAGAGAAGPPRRRTRGHLPGLQRGLLGHQRRPVDPRRPVRRGAPAGPDAGRADAVRHRDARPARADRDPGVAAAGPHRTRRRAGAAARPGPHPLGPPADPARPGEHRPDRAARRHGRSVRPAGGDRRLPRAGPVAEDTDWERITALYDGLARISPSPVVELNRGVATAQAFGPEAGLAIVLPLFDVPSMRDYHLLPAVAGDLLCRSGAHEQAREHFLRAAAMTRNSVERTTMQRRAAQCAARHAMSP